MGFIPIGNSARMELDLVAALRRHSWQCEPWFRGNSRWPQKLTTELTVRS